VGSITGSTDVDLSKKFDVFLFLSEGDGAEAAQEGVYRYIFLERHSTQ